MITDAIAGVLGLMFVTILPLQLWRIWRAGTVIDDGLTQNPKGEPK